MPAPRGRLRAIENSCIGINPALRMGTGTYRESLVKRVPPGAEMRRPIVFCIDVEPNDHVPRAVSGDPWSGFRESLPLLAELREKLRSRTGRPVRFSWFL